MTDEYNLPMGDHREVLLRVAAQIKKLLNDNDMAGIVALHKPGELEVLVELEPSYSMVKAVEGEPGVYHFHSVLAEYGGDKDKQDYDIAATANMLGGLGEIMGRSAMTSLALHDQMAKKFDIEHTPMRKMP